MSLPQTVATNGRDRVRLWILFASVFFVGMSEFMLAAMLTPLSVAFDTDAVHIAWLISSYALAYAIAAPVLGYWSDRIDRSQLLRIALLAFAIDGIGIAFSPTLHIAIALRVFGGLASAVIIPTSFALISEVIPRDSQSSAMGKVMLGMTVGIALGPALAGVLTAWLGWRAPFLLTSIGCIVACVVGSATLSKRGAIVVTHQTNCFKWLRDLAVVRPLLAKGLWNGTGVSAFLLSGEVLRHRYQFDVAEIGLSTTVFGVGLGIGNLLTGALRRMTGSEERSLVVSTVLLIVSIAAFQVLPLPVGGTLLCLAAWGAALGAGAPSATAVLAARSGSDKGVVLATAETLNNIVILSTVPLASVVAGNASIEMVMPVFAVGLGVGLMLTVYDAQITRRVNRQSRKDLRNIRH